MEKEEKKREIIKMCGNIVTKLTMQENKYTLYYEEGETHEIL
jgi:hypothetical protein